MKRNNFSKTCSRKHTYKTQECFPLDTRKANKANAIFHTCEECGRGLSDCLFAAKLKANKRRFQHVQQTHFSQMKTQKCVVDPNRSRRKKK